MTPLDQGFRWPAEWEPQSAVWLAWPHDASLWNIHLEPVWETFADLIAVLADAQPVHVLVQNEEVESQARLAISESVRRRELTPNKIFYWTTPTNDCWIRDTGPTFINGPDFQAAVCWRFNGWGKFEPWAEDDIVSDRIASGLQIPSWSPGVVFEGGAIDGNGAGSAITTEQCLLNDNRNAGLEKSDYEKLLRDYLGVEQLIWLGQGLHNDHTDGHVDVVTRFVSQNRVATLWTPDKSQPSFESLEDNLKRLNHVRLPSGPLEVVLLPLPEPVVFEGELLAAGYANFVIANGRIVVPMYGCPQDAEAMTIIAKLFPNRRVVGLSATSLLHGGGAFHCVTQQQPSFPIH